MATIPNDTLAIFNQQGFASSIEPQTSGARQWPPSGVHVNFLDGVVVNPKNKFGYGSGAGRVTMEVPSVSFKFTWVEDPEVTAGAKTSGLEWESDAVYILTEAQFRGLPENQRKRVEIAYARLLGSFTSLLGRKVTMPEIGALIGTVNDATQGDTPLQVRVYVKNEPNKKDSKYQDQEAQIRELVSGVISA